MGLDDMVTNIAYLPSGELLVSTLRALQRRDPAGKKVLKSRPVRMPVVGVSSTGPIYLADEAKVVTLDPATLAPTGKVKFPSARSAGGKLQELAVSTDGTALAGLTSDGTLHIQKLDGSAQESHPSYGERCEKVGFVDPITVASVTGNTVAHIRKIGEARTAAQINGVQFIAVTDGKIVSLSHSVDLYDAKGTKLAAFPELPFLQGAALVPGKPWLIALTETNVLLVDIKTRKVLHEANIAPTGSLSLQGSRLAVATDDGIVILSVPDLTVVQTAEADAGARGSAKPKKSAAKTTPAPKKKSKGARVAEAPPRA